MKYISINCDEELIEFRKKLYRDKIDIIAVDFEAEYKLHTNEEKLCLIQIFDNTNYYIIDPFNISKNEIQKTFEDKRTIKLFYGASSDKSLLLEQYNIQIKSLLDLKVLVDTIGFEHKGLDSILNEVLGITVVGKKRYQKHNWTLRPIDSKAIEYALSDVRYLFILKSELIKRINDTKKVEKLIINMVKNENTKNKQIKPKIFRTKEYKELSNIEQCRFEKIFLLRESVAEDTNTPPNNVILNEKLFELSKNSEAINNLAFSKRLDSNVRQSIINKIKILWEETI